MAVGFSNTNKPLNPRGQDASPKGYNRASLFSGKALDFDGVNDYVTFDGFAGTLSNNDAWTACGYFKTDSNTRATWFSAHHSSGSNRIRVGLETNKDGLFYADIYTGDVQIGDFDFKDNQWHFVALSREQGGAGSLLTLYVDGVELTSLGTGIDWDTATQFSLGQEWDGASTGDFWDGLLSNFKIFNTALTAAQVADLYNNPEKVVPTGVDNTALKLWLPMMEGAGTTAYDGSGNGNHGTISGATYVNGIGAPSPQSAVMDWNKGSNSFTYSEELINSSWTKSGATANDGESDPLGTSRATELTESNISEQHVLISNSISITSGTQYYISVLAKQGSGSRYLGFAGMGLAGASESPVFDLQNGSVDLGASSTIAKSANIEAYGSNGWYKCSMVLQANSTASLGFYFTLVSTATDNGVSGYNYTGNGTSSIFLFAPMFKVGSAEGVYAQTIATTQTTPVLLPQGLTTGRDITGVNLFENVRKQGALNLDGNSWAEVHDNASLDITSAITLEAWVYWDSTQTATGILGKWNSSSTQCYLIYSASSSRAQFYISTTGSNAQNVEYSIPSDGWVHIVGTDDGTNQKLYINGAEEATTSSLGSIFESALPLEIGRYNESTAREYGDQIAQPRIYNRALTAEEVQRNYNSGKNTYTND